MSERSLTNPSLTVALVHNWPGKRNSELDLIQRMLVVLESQGQKPLVIDPLGSILSRDGDPLGEMVNEADVDLVLNLHYTNPKWLDALSYVVNWNPLEYIVDDPFTGFPVSEPHLRYLMDCLRSHDRALSAGSDLVDRYAALVRNDEDNRVLSEVESPELHTTIPASYIGSNKGWVSERSADNFRIFYIGTNWEKTSRSRKKRVRHKGLFELLGESGRFDFFGLRKQNGIELWDGVSGYRGELPFDGGQSIITETRKAGVTLVLSSPQHQRSGLVSTRIFQACAACAIIISDKNPFVLENFGDSVIYFDYGRSHEKTAENIKQKVAWIREHWEQAVAKAERAQQIFLKNFTLEFQLEQICTTAKKDIENQRELKRTAEEKLVCIHYLYRDNNKAELNRCLQNIDIQTHKNLELVIHTHGDLIDDCRAKLERSSQISYCIRVYPELELRLGETLRSFKKTKGEFHLWYSNGFDWSSAHVANLLNGMITTECSVYYAPFFADFEELRSGGESIRYFIKGLNGGYDRLRQKSIEALDMTRIATGNILFARRALERAYLDNLRLLDLLAIFLILKTTFDGYESEIGFSPRVTAWFQETKRAPLNLQYSEYDLLPQPWNHGRTRDLQLYQGLAQNKAVLPLDEDALTMEEVYKQFSLLTLIKHSLSGFTMGATLINVVERVLSRVR